VKKGFKLLSRIADNEYVESASNLKVQHFYACCTFSFPKFPEPPASQRVNVAIGHLQARTRLSEILLTSEKTSLILLTSL
jgi:hypothetical protein